MSVKPPGETATDITGPCSCAPAYKDRGLEAPDCALHLFADEIADALRERDAEHAARLAEAERERLALDVDYSIEVTAERMFCAYMGSPSWDGLDEPARERWRDGARSAAASYAGGHSRGCRDMANQATVQTIAANARAIAAEAESARLRAALDEIERILINDALGNKVGAAVDLAAAALAPPAAPEATDRPCETCGGSRKAWRDPVATDMADPPQVVPCPVCAPRAEVRAELARRGIDTTAAAANVVEAARRAGCLREETK